MNFIYIFKLHSSIFHFSKDINARLDDYLKRAKETLQQKLAINPKPQKRLMRIVDDDEEEIPTTTAFVPIQRESMDKSFRPSRTAKTKATQQLVRRFIKISHVRKIEVLCFNRKKFRCLVKCVMKITR